MLLKTAHNGSQHLRVLMVSNFYPPYVAGGAELIAFYLSVWLASAGVEVTIVSTCGPETEECDSVVDGVRVIRYFPENLWWNFERFAAKDRRSTGAKLLWNFRELWNRASAHRFGCILDGVKPDVVHTHNIKGFSPAVWREITRRRIPLIHTTHDYYLLCQRGTMLNRNGEACTRQCYHCSALSRWFKTFVREADFICSPSKFVLNRHQSLGFSGRRGCVVVPNGVPGNPVRRLPKPVNKRLNLLYLGQLRREKGVHLLADAIARLGSEIHLSVAGEGELKSALTGLAARDHRISMHGFVSGEEKERLLAEADVLLFPSTWTENAPLVIAEAMMRGIPVLASDLGAIPEFVHHQVNGLLFPVGESAALAKAVQRLLAEANLLSQLSAGASRSAENWTVCAMAQGYLDLYRTAHAKMPSANREFVH